MLVTPAVARSFRGRGPRDIVLPQLRHLANVAIVRHRGPGALTVRAVDRSGSTADTLIDTVGDYCGTVPLDFTAEPATLRIHADGEWTLEVAPLNTAPWWDGSAPFLGAGDAVLNVADLGDEPLSVPLSCLSASRVIVWAWGESRDLLLDRAAPCTDRAEIPVGTAVLTVQARGAWCLGT